MGSLLQNPKILWVVSIYFKNIYLKILLIQKIWKCVPLCAFSKQLTKFLTVQKYLLQEGNLWARKAKLLHEHTSAKLTSSGFLSLPELTKSDRSAVFCQIGDRYEHWSSNWWAHKIKMHQPESPYIKKYLFNSCTFTKKKWISTCSKRSYKRTSSSGLVTFSFLSSCRFASLLFATLTNKRLRSMVLSARTALTALSRPFKSSFTLSALPVVA